jgi:DNA-binding transcriptional LysR family regulator
MVDVRRLAVLRELHRCGTVTAAAAALHLTPSAVSQNLAALGRETRTRLVEPHGRGIRLTGAGLVLLKHAEAVFAELERTDAAVAALAEGEAGAATIGAFPTAINGIVIPALAALRRDRPGLRIGVLDLTGDDAVTALMHGRIDVALWLAYPGSRSPEERGAVGEPLLADAMDVVLPADHPLAGSPMLRLADLKDETWIAGSPESPCRRLTNAACAAVGFAPLVEHCTDDWTAVVGLVGAGMGVALVPRLARPTAPPSVVVRPVAPAPPQRSIQLLVRPAAAGCPHLSAVVGALRDAAQSTAEAIAA